MGVSAERLAEIRGRLSVSEVVGTRVKLHRQGGEMAGLCPFHQERTASFTVNDDKGFYHCFGCGAHGDVLDFLGQTQGLDFLGAVAEAARWLGLAEGDDAPPGPSPGLDLAPAPYSEAQRQRDEERRAKRESRIEWAQGVWRSALPAAGSLVEVYLRARGITLPPPPSLRFLAGHKHPDTGLELPCMVACMQDGAGRFAGIHRTWLRADGRDKAGVKRQRIMAGDAGGSAVRFGPPGRHQHLGEGNESSLSVLQALRRKDPSASLWAVLSVDNFAKVVLPPLVREVTLWGDNDAKDRAAGKAKLEAAAQVHRQRGLRAETRLPPPDMDFNDLLQAGDDFGGRP